MRALKKKQKEQRKQEVSMNGKEELTNEEIKELMGIDRPTYRRERVEHLDSEVADNE